MRKETYNKYKDCSFTCKECHKTLPSNCFSYNLLRSDFTGVRCKFCDWKYRNKNKEISYKRFDTETAEEILSLVLYDKVYCINDIHEHYPIYSIDEIIELLRHLKLGNKGILKVRVACTFCGKEILKTVSDYYANTGNYYCSYECYHSDQPRTLGSGENNRCYNRIQTQCTECGKTIKIIPYNYNKRNSYGENNNFCSQSCYWKFRSRHYVGQKNHNYIDNIKQDTLDKLRIAKAKYLSNNVPNLNTGIQLKVNDILDECGIKYIREYPIDFYAIDNYLQDYDLIIEVMGDYWHSSPLIFNDNGRMINDGQRKTISGDKAKLTYFKKHYRLHPLYLWESDINNSYDKCKALVALFVNSNGIISEYNSFNYQFLDNKLSLIDNPIKPYFYLPKEEYKHLIKE